MPDITCDFSCMVVAARDAHDLVIQVEFSRFVNLFVLAATQLTLAGSAPYVYVAVLCLTSKSVYIYIWVNAHLT